jgi:hypothetical protein
MEIVYWSLVTATGVVYLVVSYVAFRFFYRFIYHCEEIAWPIVLGLGWFVSLPLLAVIQIIRAILQSVFGDRR